MRTRREKEPEEPQKRGAPAPPYTPPTAPPEQYRQISGVRGLRIREIENWLAPGVEDRIYRDPLLDAVRETGLSSSSSPRTRTSFNPFSRSNPHELSRKGNYRSPRQRFN